MEKWEIKEWEICDNNQWKQPTKSASFGMVQSVQRHLVRRAAAFGVRGVRVPLPEVWGNPVEQRASGESETNDGSRRNVEGKSASVLMSERTGTKRRRGGLSCPSRRGQ